MSHINELVQFLKGSPTAYHAVNNVASTLEKHGFKQLTHDFDVQKGGAYYVTRNGSSFAAFKIGEEISSDYSFNIVAAHTDSPTFKLKQSAEHSQSHYIQLNTEGYGGMIMPSWFDRPLSIAGRAVVKRGNRYQSELVTIDRDLVLIPNVAIHMNPNINNGYSYNKQIDLLPLLSGDEGQKGDLKALLAEALDVDQDALLSYDLILYNRQAPTIWGMHQEFVSAARLDDLECVFGGMKALINASHPQSIDVLAVFDNEEVGSLTKQGAQSNFLRDTLKCLNNQLGFDEHHFYNALNNSLLISADNAHAVHPNHPELLDADNRAYMNNGVVIKSHAGQKYTSDAVGIALVKACAQEADVPLQYFANRSDQPGGSTLGRYLMSQLSMNSVDIGLAQLAMHSCYETAGVKDIDYLIDLLTCFYAHHFKQIEDGCFQID